IKISNKASIYNHEMISIGDNSRIDDFCVISGKISIGKNVHIAVFCNVAGGEKGIIMEDFSGLAYSVNIFTQSDDYSGMTLTNPTVPDKYKKEMKEKIIIKKHVIVGAGSMVFPGVVLEEGCSIGAMSMVTRSTEPWKIYSGIPARPKKERLKNLLEYEKEYLNESNR
ncbi:MAG TPA: acyltransferase, partial [Anaerovoracaceae bacterium]|nr:acyltransferase [Anaerovoracaceae bacterium]